MVLRCECGGALELKHQAYPEDPQATARERYQCVDCNRTGWYVFGGGVDRTSGCVTIVDEPYL